MEIDLVMLGRVLLAIGAGGLLVGLFFSFRIIREVDSMRSQWSFLSVIIVLFLIGSLVFMFQSPTTLSLLYLTLMISAIFGVVGLFVVLVSHLSYKTIQIVRRATALEVENAKLASLARHDALTNLYNRIFLSDSLQRLLSRVKRGEKGLAVMYLDLDNFKEINDQYGHKSGDIVLKAIADLFSARTRHGDILARVGGDEFVVLLHGVTLETAMQAAESYCVALRSNNVWLEDFKIEFSVRTSAGVYMITPDCEDDEQAIAHADKACYVAKHKGGDCVAVYTE